MKKPQRSTQPRALPRGDRSTGKQDALRVHVRIAICNNLLMREARQRISARWDLTLPQFDVMAELARSAGTGFTFAELSRLLLVTSGNLTGIVDRLEEQNLLRRHPDLHDRRVIRIMLTDKGRAMTRTMLRQHARDISEILSVMPRSSLVQLSGLLGRLRDGLQQRGSSRSEKANGRRRAGRRR